MVDSRRLRTTDVRAFLPRVPAYCQSFRPCRDVAHRSCDPAGLAKGAKALVEWKGVVFRSSLVDVLERWFGIMELLYFVAMLASLKEPKDQFC